MNSSAFFSALTGGKPARRLLAGISAWLVIGLAAASAEDETAAEKIPAPRAALSKDAEMQLSIFEKQFRIDTGEGESTRRGELERRIEIKVGAKERMVFKFDLTAWPKTLRPVARVWVAVGAPSTITTEGTLHVNFSQAGVGVSTGLDNTFNREGVILMGCDYAERDGAITIEIENPNHLSAVPCTVRAIVYLPRKLNLGNPVKT